MVMGRDWNRESNLVGHLSRKRLKRIEVLTIWQLKHTSVSWKITLSTTPKAARLGTSNPTGGTKPSWAARRSKRTRRRSRQWAMWWSGGNRTGLARKYATAYRTASRNGSTSPAPTGPTT
ncbi:hypothetical protein QAD02_002351 [Eretmocerus hayati]|uniref:Uncharacterized protein n=1 Tax=Eretmocerus hayati TaxID=131215 RepID=A0ACC2NJ24_9HYME|nr:hypothetical protein QAD02_002351 [Eretmocerus hayati]